MSTEDITLSHVEKMLKDAKVAAGCTAKCTHAVSEGEQAGTRYFTITHYAGNAKDSQTIPAASMSLMEESAIANFLLSRHETMRLEAKAAKELADEVKSVRAAQNAN